MRVIVLGCGPAGLLAAQAVQEVGYHPIIVSVKQPSNIGGAQYLHRSIPGVTGSEGDGMINFVKQGSSTGYSNKVYGTRHVHTSWEAFDEGSHPCWNLRAAYNRLWDMFGYQVVDMNVSPVKVARLLESDKYAAVLSTVPLNSICMNSNHHFRTKEVWISQDADALTEGSDRFRYANRVVEGNTIIWNGDLSVLWYRQSYIFGFPGTEWPEHPRDRKVVRVIKPISTDCTCWPGLVRLGRYGEWRKGVLAHHAYEGAILALCGKGTVHAMQ